MWPWQLDANWSVICREGEKNLCAYWILLPYTMAKPKLMTNVSIHNEISSNNSKMPKRPWLFPSPPQIKWAYILTGILTGKCHTEVPLEQREWCWKTAEQLPSPTLVKLWRYSYILKKFMASVKLEYSSLWPSVWTCHSSFMAAIGTESQSVWGEAESQKSQWVILLCPITSGGEHYSQYSWQWASLTRPPDFFQQ